VTEPNWFGRVLNRLTGFGSIPTSRIMQTGRTDAGVYVDADTALKNATVWACVQYLARTVAQLPWRVMADTSAGGGKVQDTNPADWLIHKRPNPEMGSFTFRQTLMTSALLRGNGYAEIQRDARGAPYALWPIHADRVTPRRDRDGALYYEISNAGGPAELDAMDMFHVRGFGDGPVGYNVVQYAAQSIGWAQATEQFGATFFGEGMNPSGLIEVAKGMSPGAMEILRGELDRLYKGPRGKRTAILDAGMKFQKLATNPDDAQFIESMQHQVEVICRWFGVPPHKVMHLLRATFSNIEHQSIEVVVDSVTPWVKIFEEEADYKLFGANRQNLYTKMNLRGLMRGDNASRAAYYKDLFGVGAFSTNDILSLEDMNPIGPEGDQRFVPLNMVTLADAAKPRPVPGGSAATPDPAEDPAPPGKPSGGARPLPN
jgi:HK97 family phage portal protein